MTVKIVMPRIGHSMTEGKVLEWLVEEGAEVKAGDPLLTVETDKTSFDVEAPEPGVLVSCIAEPGEDYDVDAVLGVLSVGDAVGQNENGTKQPLPVNMVSALEETAFNAPGNKIRAAPKARQIARGLQVDLADVKPTGPDGIITVEDVQRTHSESANRSDAATKEAREGDGEIFEGRRVRSRRELSKYERGMVKTMRDVWADTPLFTQQMDIDFSAAIALRNKWKAGGGARASVSYNDMALKALAQALVDIPEANAVVEGDEKVLLADVNLGLAVASDQGLAVPVIKNADQLSMADISQATRAMAEKVRQGTLTMDDMGQGSATVSNLGLFGVKAGTSIPDRGQFMLLFLGAIEERTVVRDGMMVIVPMATISATYDHRILDGMTAARLSGRVKELLEAPELLD